MNNCVFDGRLARDAELKDLGDNKVCNFSIGSNVGFGEKQKTIWLDCSIWGRRGEALNDSLKKVNKFLSLVSYPQGNMKKMVFLKLHYL